MMRVTTMFLAMLLVIAAAVLAACSRSSSPTATSSYYFKDTVDSGSDAVKAGCHVEYLTKADCQAGTRVVGVKGDSCLSTASINEYTNNNDCHEHNTNTTPADISALNCSEICGSRGGKCEAVANACSVGGVTSDSARCVCN